MTPAVQRRVRVQTERILRRGLFPVLRRFLPTKAIEDYHREQGCRQRVFSPLVTVWALVWQALSGGSSDAATAAMVGSWLRRVVSPRSGSYSKARGRLSDDFIASLARAVGWAGVRGRPVLIIDGTTLSLSDTAANQKRYPQPPRQKRGCGFPVMRVVALMDARTGAVLAWATGSLGGHEATLARPIWDRVPAGSIVIADRLYASYALVAGLGSVGIDVVTKQHAGRRNQRPGKATDWVETWRRTKDRKAWPTGELPSELQVRVIRHRLPTGGTMVLNTTLSRRQANAAHVAQWYRERWRIETQFGLLKGELGLSPAASRTPESAERWLASVFLALNLLSRARAEVGKRRGWDAWRVSAVGLLADLGALLSWPARGVRSAWEWLSSMAVLIPDRPGRHEPRVKKRRGSDYNYMTAPRHAYPERHAQGRA